MVSGWRTTITIITVLIAGLSFWVEGSGMHVSPLGCPTRRSSPRRTRAPADSFELTRPKLEVCSPYGSQAHRCPFWFNWSNNRGRFLVYVGVPSTTRGTRLFSQKGHLPPRARVVCTSFFGACRYFQKLINLCVNTPNALLVCSLPAVRPSSPEGELRESGTPKTELAVGHHFGGFRCTHFR